MVFSAPDYLKVTPVLAENYDGRVSGSGRFVVDVLSGKAQEKTCGLSFQQSRGRDESFIHEI